MSPTRRQRGEGHHEHLPIDVGSPRQEWCDDCFTPAVVVCDLIRLTQGGVSVLGSFRACWRCNPEVPGGA